MILAFWKMVRALAIITAVFSGPLLIAPFVVKLVRDDAAFATEIECTAFLTNLTVAGVLISVSICIAWACNDYIKNKSNQSSEPT